MGGGQSSEDCCYIMLFIVWCSVSDRPGKQRMCICCSPNYCGINDFGVVVFPPKSPDVRHGDRSDADR